MDDEGFPPLEAKNGGVLDEDQLYSGRFGKISQLVKELRVSCS